MKTIDTIENEYKSGTMLAYDRLRMIPAIGIIFALFAAFFSATANFLVKLVHGVHAVEIAAIRSSVQAIVFLIFLLITRQSFRAKKGETLHLILRCIFGFLALVFIFLSLRMIPLGDSAAITYSAPVLVTVIARVYLKEKCDIVDVIALFVTASGIILITKPSFLFSNENDDQDEHRLVGCLFAVGGAFGTALSFVLLRKLQNTPSIVVVFWNSLFSVVAGTTILITMNEFKMAFGLKNILVALSIGICSIFGQLCVTMAFKFEEAGPVSLVRTISIVIAFIYQIFLLNEQLEWTSLVGALIILISVICLSIRKWHYSKKMRKSKSVDTLDTEKISVETGQMTLIKIN